MDKGSTGYECQYCGKNFKRTYNSNFDGHRNEHYNHKWVGGKQRDLLLLIDRIKK